MRLLFGGDVKKSYSYGKDNNSKSWLFPFVKRVMPRIGVNQSFFGLSIISLDTKFDGEEEIERHGLEPLLKVNIITPAEAETIIRWYLRTEPTWDSGGSVGGFQKNLRSTADDIG